ncbi:sugar ABC transporter permease [Chloroflexi bacterium TSY]|nr:sugar ABC transporter permease [Chloroflexi bacterium TSY]
MVAATSLWDQIKKNKIAYLWIAPFFIQFLIFWAWPILFTFILSFQKWEIIGAKEFIGLSNYRTLFQDDWFWTTFRNTIFYWAAIVPIRTLLVLVLAYILHSSKLKWGSFFRTTYIMPYLISEVFVGLLFVVILAEKGGTLNVFLANFGLDPIPWLTSPDWSKISIALMAYWASFGYFTVIMLGGLQRISPDYIEAALIDGASSNRIFWAIIVPLMRPTILFVVIISTIGVFSMFEGPLVLTGGGPGISSTPITLLLVSNGFEYFKMGYASSIAVVLFAIVVAVSFVQIGLLQGGDTED